MKDTIQYRYRSHTNIKESIKGSLTGSGTGVTERIRDSLWCRMEVKGHRGGTPFPTCGYPPTSTRVWNFVGSESFLNLQPLVSGSFLCYPALRPLRYGGGPFFVLRSRRAWPRLRLCP